MTKRLPTAFQKKTSSPPLQQLRHQFPFFRKTLQIQMNCAKNTSQSHIDMPFEGYVMHIFVFDQSKVPISKRL